MISRSKRKPNSNLIELQLTKQECGNINNLSQLLKTEYQLSIVSILLDLVLLLPNNRNHIGLQEVPRLASFSKNKIVSASFRILKNAFLFKPLKTTVVLIAVFTFFFFLKYPA